MDYSGIREYPAEILSALPGQLEETTIPKEEPQPGSLLHPIGFARTLARPPLKSTGQRRCPFTLSTKYHTPGSLDPILKTLEVFKSNPEDGSFWEYTPNQPECARSPSLRSSWILVFFGSSEGTKADPVSFICSTSVSRYQPGKMKCPHCLPCSMRRWPREGGPFPD